MKKIILWILNICTILIGLFFGLIWLNRLGMKYNSEGKYFDETTSVIIKKKGILVYGTLTLLFIIIGIISWTITWKSKQTCSNRKPNK